MLLCYLFLFIFLSTPFFGVIDARSQPKENNTPLIDFIRGYNIDFTPPEPILECGQSFNLDVNLTKTRLQLPFAFSVSVFLELTDEYGIKKVTRIGMLPYVVPSANRNFTVSVPCLTMENFASNLLCLKSGQKRKVDFYDAKIGVKIDKPMNWGLQGLFWRLVTNNLPELSLGLFNDTEGPVWQFIALCGSWAHSMPLLNQFRLLYILQRINSFFKGISPTIVWKETKIIRPFVCTDKVTFNAVVPDKTDEHGRFDITVYTTNNLNVAINTSIIVDVTDEGFINTLMPTAQPTHYNVGYNDTKIESGKIKPVRISCKFTGGNFIKKDYIVRVEVGPYINIGDTNQFGIYFYNIRWLTLVKPNYKVDTNATEAIQKFWYNLPLFDATSTSIFPYKDYTIAYKGHEEPTIIDEVNKTVTSVLLINFFLTIILIVLACLGYWFIRKHT